MGHPSTIAADSAATGLSVLTRVSVAMADANATLNAVPVTLPGSSMNRVPGLAHSHDPPPLDRHSLTLLFRCADSSFLMSSGDSFGRSTLMVSLLSLAVSGNGGL